MYARPATRTFGLYFGQTKPITFESAETKNCYAYANTSRHYGIGSGSMYVDYHGRVPR